MTLAIVQEEAMRLSNAERAELLDWLWEGMQSEATLRTQQRWVAEAEERIDAVDRGELTTLDGPSALASVRDSLRS